MENKLTYGNCQTLEEYMEYKRQCSREWYQRNKEHKRAYQREYYRRKKMAAANEKLES